VVCAGKRNLWSDVVPAGVPNPIDVHVGGRVRMRRIEIDMSQQTLGQHLGLTFQQIQKYERGTNRIGASRLQAIGKVLEVPVAYLFEGAPDGYEGTPGSQTSNALLQLLGTREGQTLLDAFGRITDVEIRRGFTGLIDRVAALIDSKPPRPKRSRPKISDRQV
jgi:transcriptional regulator with XRE-family HTH domain